MRLGRCMYWSRSPRGVDLSLMSRGGGGGAGQDVRGFGEEEGGAISAAWRVYVSGLLPSEDISNIIFV